MHTARFLLPAAVWRGIVSLVSFISQVLACDRRSQVLMRLGNGRRQDSAMPPVVVGEDCCRWTWQHRQEGTLPPL